jgi:uncharacterized protein
MNRSAFPWRLIGMVHLSPLPGAPEYGGSPRAIRDRAVRDATILERCGFDALLLENYGDAPFWKDAVPAYVVAHMTALALAVRDAVRLPIGVQILRNDARAGLAVAHASGASFIRVNVHTGAMLTDQGVIEGRAAEVLRLRAQLGADVRIFADVLVKHAAPLAPTDIAAAARESVQRGKADAVIVSGAGTGQPSSLSDIERVARAVNAPVLVGSGSTPRSVREELRLADGIIVGTCIKRGGNTSAPVDARRAAAFVRAAR